MTQLFDKDGDSNPLPVPDQIAQSRLIVGAFAMGSLLFAVVVLVVIATSGPVMGANAPAGVLVAGVAVVLLVAAPVAGAVMQRDLERRKRLGETLTAERVSVVVVSRAAMVEASALLGGVAGLLAGAPYLLITAAGVAGLLVMWLQLPDRVRTLLEETDTSTWRG